MLNVAPQKERIPDHLRAMAEQDDKSPLSHRSGLLPPLWDHHEMQGFPDQLLIGLVIATLPLSLAA